LDASKLKTVTGMVVRSGPPPFHDILARESDYQSLWFTLARVPWRSLVLVPVDADGSAAGMAVSLADVGQRLRPGPVTFLLMAGRIDYASAEMFVSAVATRVASGQDDPAPPRVIVSVPPVVVEPLALAVTGAADAVALCVTKGRTQLADAERTIHLIGRERLLGCILK
jgi:hypothetical protein